MTSWVQKLQRRIAERAARNIDPLSEPVASAVKAKEAISTAALLDLLDMRKTVGNARRIAKIMRALDFVPIRNRQLMPGGFRDTICRGWARPVRESQMDAEQGKKIGSTPLSTGQIGQQGEGWHVQRV